MSGRQNALRSRLVHLLCQGNGEWKKLSQAGADKETFHFCVVFDTGVCLWSCKTNESSKIPNAVTQ